MTTMQQRIITILWPSFLAAGLGTIVLFEVVNPYDLIGPAWLIRFGTLEIYTLGFIFLWSISALACYLTCYFQSPADKVPSSSL